MKRLILTLIILFICIPAQAADKWSKGDVAREVAFQTLNVIDYAQTDRMLRDHPNVREMNPLLGERPSTGTLAVAALVMGAGHAVVTHYIPAKWRPWWQYCFIVVKVGAIANNYHVAAGMEF